MKWRVVMLRKLAVFIISAGLTMSPLSVQALGFGGIKLKSSLNEKLNAEVSLLSATANDIQSLAINLATEEAFLRSGIDRTALLNKLKFKVKQRSNGDYYIHVTTSETVREPFMNFLLELNWKNGRMLREYTMLIDPPGRAPKQFAEPAPVVAETIAPEPEMEIESVLEEAPMEMPMAMVEEAPVAAVEDSTPFLEPIIEASPFPEIEAESAVAVESEPAAEMVEPEPVLEVEPDQDLFAEIEPEAVVEPEMEMAEPVFAVAPEMEMAEAEPMSEDQVFASDAVWPRIPLAAFDQSDEGEATPVRSPQPVGDLDYGITKANDNLWNIAEKLRSGDDSVSVYQVMMALLQSNPDAFTDNNVHRLKVGHVLRIDDPTTLTSMSRKEAANSFIQQTEDWNSYRQQAAGSASVQPIMAGGASAETEVGTATAGELTLASPDGESLTAGGGANEETLSNDLATMRDQLRQAKADSGTMRTRNVALNDKLQSLEDELNRLQRSLSVKDDELAALQKQLSELNIQPVAEEPVKPEVAEPVVAEPAAEEPVKPEVTAPVVTEAPMEPERAAEPGIMDTVMGIIAAIGASIAGTAASLNLGGDSLLYIAAPIALLLLIIIVIVIKRRRAGDNFQESILTGAASASAADAAGVPSNDSTTFSEESSFLSDFAMSGASAIEADDSEVDPLTEADVFMAYGRYEAAEERLNEAVQNEPNRMELRAKLLELYHATQNKDAFESSAEDFYASLGGNESDNPLWAKVRSMGAEIAPGNPLFNAGDGATGISATAESSAFDDPGMAMTDSQVMDIGLETGVFAAAELTGSPDTSGDDLDFNLDLGESTDDAGDMDFNLDMGGDTSLEEPSADLDFNLDMGTTDSTEEVSIEAPATEDAGLDFSLDMGTPDAGGLDFDLDIGGDTEMADASLDFDTGSSDAGSLDLNLDASDTADADIGGGDEVGTKLDLAKAYIDMGDPEGARSILDEVMDEGSSTQKEEAQSLLGQIA